MIETKSEIRRRLLAKRNAMAPKEREKGSLLVTERILGHPWFSKCEDFLCFVSYGSEISTEGMIREALRREKRVYVPKVMPDREAPAMEFYRIFSEADLQPGYKGIPEPSGETERYLYSVERAKMALMLVPGAAFDRKCNRIGYGKGFYDYFLAEREALQSRTVAIGFACQLVEEIPAEETDIRPFQVICC